MEKKRRNIWRIVGIVAVIVVLLLAVGAGAFVVWGNNALPAMPEALLAMESDAAVTVTQADWIEFSPTGEPATIGFIFYPGARVDPKAYAPPLRALAEQGYFVAVTPMPLNFAILAPDRADAVMAAHPAIEHWFVGGHSLGGATAAVYADRHPDAVDGVIFWAAYPPESNSLADQPELIVSSIYGTLDGLATPAKVAASKPFVPEATQFVPIEGGNHAQFGWYGDQSGDNPATITRAEQQQQVIVASLAALASVR